MSDTGDFFRGRIDQMIDLRHPLAVLGSRMPWQEIEAGLARQFARRVREGQRKGPRQADKSNVEISGLKTLGMNDIGGTLPSDSCGLYSL